MSADEGRDEVVGRVHRMTTRGSIPGVVPKARRRAAAGESIHPYLLGATGKLDSWSLHAAASVQVDVDDTLIPCGRRPIDPIDFRLRRPIGRTTIDHAFDGFAFEGGVEAISVVDVNGEGTSITFGRTTPWVQICTSDWPAREGHRAGVAVEPMSSAPNAFSADPKDVVVVPAGGVHSAWWRIAAIESPRGDRRPRSDDVVVRRRS